MEYLSDGYTLELCEGAFPLSTDSIALSDFVKFSAGHRVLDLGSGCGTLGLLLCAAHPGCTVTGLELEETAHRTALENARANGLCHRLTSICGDIRNIRDTVAGGSFDLCVSNPPYFTGGPESLRTPRARRDDTCSMDALMSAAAWALKFGGDFFLVHKPERLGELFARAAQKGLEPKRLCLLRHKSDSPVALVLVQCRKGAKPGLVWEEATLHLADGSPTEYYRKLYHL